MKYRKLRIAWSMAWGFAAVLLVALWVRSYWCEDWLDRVDNAFVLTSVGSNAGEIFINRAYPVMAEAKFDHATFDPFQNKPTYRHGWEFWSCAASYDSPSFVWTSSSNSLAVQAPFWCIIIPTISFIIVGFFPPSKFSLRTLLIAMTLIAVLLGLIVWLTT